MLVCDYNGWADAPEEEREGLAAVELDSAWPFERRRRPRPPTGNPHRSRLAA